MEVKQNIVMFYAKNYDMMDEKGEQREGVSVAYFMGGFAPIHNADGSAGLRPSKGSLPAGYMSRLPKVPAMYEGVFTLSVGSDGKSMLKLTDARYLGEAELELVPDKVGK